LALSRNLEPLPADTHYEIRLASVLGGKYLELIPGRLKAGRVPDGGTLALSASAGRSHELPFVDLDTALAAFGPGTQRVLRGSIAGVGDVLAGRGASLNDATYSLARLIGPLESLLGVVAAPGTRLSQLLSGAAQTTGALASVAPAISALVADSATTFQALERSALGQTIDQLPATESIATAVLTRSLPTLSEAAQIVQALRPGAALLPLASQRLDQIVTAATPVFKPVPTLAANLQGALAAVQALARDPASTQTFTALGSTDLATLGSSAFVGLGAILRSIAPAQFACNVAGLWTRNFASSMSEGDNTGGWLRTMPLFDSSQSSEAASPASDLHLNYYPSESSSQCQAGNEGYTGTQLIGNPPRTSRVVDNTAPPPGVLERGKRAGLVP
jgi:ABC-type transporter Mla subunit MlaD